MATFDKLLRWMDAENVGQVALTARLNAVPGRKSKRRTLSQINRMLNGHVRFADPFMGDEIQVATAGKVTARDYIKHVRACAEAQRRAA